MSDEQGLIERLTAQMRAKGADDPERAALDVLYKRGHVDLSGRLTPLGLQRQALGREGRALDRASKETGKPASEFTYDAEKNRAKKRKP